MLIKISKYIVYVIDVNSYVCINFYKMIQININLYHFYWNDVNKSITTSVVKIDVKLYILCHLFINNTN